MEERIDIPFKTVFNTTNVIMASTVHEDLVRAGFKALLNDVGDGEFHVVVASADYDNAHALVVTNPKYEIFTVPKE